jgi:T5orf172 domain-containing protein
MSIRLASARSLHNLLGKISYKTRPMGVHIRRASNAGRSSIPKGPVIEMTDLAAAVHDDVDTAGSAANTHGYVYAFAHKGQGWVKVGMTTSDDEARCWGRISHYIKAHSLPAKGWEFVGFIPSTNAQALETLVHRKLAKFRVVRNGGRTELFHCSVIAYMATLDLLDEFIAKTSPEGAAEAARQAAREAQARAKRELVESSKRERAERAKRDLEAEQKRKAHECRKALDKLLTFKLTQAPYYRIQRWDAQAVSDRSKEEETLLRGRLKQREELAKKARSWWANKAAVLQEIAANEDAIQNEILEIAILQTLHRKISWEKNNPSSRFEHGHYLFPIPSDLSDNDLITIVSRNRQNEELLKNIAALSWSAECDAALDRLKCRDISYIFGMYKP